jgi:hypothetical protein
MQIPIIRRGGASLTGSSSAGLNFTVVGGTTQPTDLSENIIWINTDINITKWTIAPYTPQYIDYTPEHGDVWICTVPSGQIKIDVQQNNDMILFPFTMYLYNTNTWERVTGKIYQNSTWTDLTGVVAIYENGTVNRQLIGDFTTAVTITYNADNFYTGTTGYVYSLHSFDVTPYSKLKVISKNENGESWKFGLNTSQSVGSNYATFPASTGGFVEKIYDISSFTGNYYFVAYIKSRNTVTSITLEV